MTIRILRLLRGYIFIIILNRSILTLTADCTTSIENNITKAICTNQIFLEGVPPNLSEDIEYLDLSGSKISKIMTADSFKKYKKLKWLSLKQCTISDPDVSKNINKDDEVFKPLDNLEYLDMSGLKQVGFPNYKWPPSIKILKVNHTGIPKKLDVSSIQLLEYVDASSTQITSFPLLNPKAPVKTVIINDVNAMFTAEEIAQYCHITTLQMNLKDDSDLKKPAHYCECMRLSVWKSKCNMISTHVKCDNSGEKCELGEPSFLNCVTSRQKCFIGDQIGGASSLMIFSVLFLILLVAVTTAIAYRYANLRLHFKPIAHVDVGLADEEEEVADEDEATEEEGSPV